MSNNKTAMNWFIEELFKKIDYIQVDPKLIEQALAMEAEQLNQACYDGYYSEQMMDTREYYNNTYGKHSQKKL